MPDTLNPNVTSWLVYDPNASLPDAQIITDDFDPFDDFTLVPQDNLTLYDRVDLSLELDFEMDNLGDGAN